MTDDCFSDCLVCAVDLAHMLADGNICVPRGPEQIASGRVDQREGKAGAAQTVSEAGRAMLADLMKEGLGDHILLLRLYQACKTNPCRYADAALLCGRNSLRVLCRQPLRHEALLQLWLNASIHRTCRDVF